VFAVAMGHLFNQEALEPSLIYGGLLVISGLLIYIHSFEKEAVGK